MKGRIFDIVRSSFVDGPGIRTTVFFKGCNLRCAWCHNPESQSAEAELMFYGDKCVGCGRCREICPSGLENCILCGKCELHCPNDARRVCGREEESASILGELLSDREYYSASAGGVTFSGGECMLQIEFLAELLKGCKSAGIHTAVDTAGYVPFDSFERIIQYTDLFLYDIKCADSDLHKRWTGVPNGLILENLRRLSDIYRGDIIIRVPLICGVNDAEAEMRRIASVLKDVKYSSLEVLPYHKMGEHKYGALGKKAEIFSAPNEESCEKLKKYCLEQKNSG